MWNAQSPIRACIIEDDAEFADFLVGYLESRDVHATRFSSAEQFLDQAQTESCDFVIIDLGLPALDGIDLISIIRSRSQCGILVISGRVGPDAFISALSAGADMVLNKPVRFDQVFHALQTIARRMHGSSENGGSSGKWRIFADASTLLSPSDEQIPLTPVEARVISRLMQAGISPVSREDLTIAAGIHGDAAQRNLDATIFRLRRKIEQKAKRPPPLRTSHGVGYRLSESISRLSGADLLG